MPVTYLRKVKANELDRVIEIIEEAKTVLRGRGVNLWQNGYPDQQTLKMIFSRGMPYFSLNNIKYLASAP